MVDEVKSRSSWYSLAGTQRSETEKRSARPLTWHARTEVRRNDLGGNPDTACGLPGKISSYIPWRCFGGV